MKTKEWFVESFDGVAYLTVLNVIEVKEKGRSQSKPGVIQNN